MKGLTVCMVTRRFFPQYGGGAMAALNLSLKLKERGLQVFVLTKNYSFSILPKCDEVMGIRVYRLPNIFPGWRLSKYLFQISMWPFFLIYRRDFDIIHAHGASYHTYAALMASRVLKKKCVVTMTLAGTSDPASIIKNKRHGKTYVWLLSTAERMISKSSELSSLYLQSGLPANRLSYIPNGVNIKDFCPLSTHDKLRLRQRLGLGDKEPIFVFVGIIGRRKGVDLLAASWINVVRELPRAKLLIVGPNPHRRSSAGFLEELKGQIRNRGAEGTVDFVGHVHNVKDYLRAADVFVLPTRGEGLPNSLLEAMACGLPPVVGKLDCTAEVVEHGRDGFLSPHDSPAITHYLLELGKNAPLREALGREARKTVVERFSLDKTADKHIDLYKELLS